MTATKNTLPPVKPSAVALAGIRELVVPALIALAGDRAAIRYIEFFTVTIRNPNTRAAYARATAAFPVECESHGLTLPAIQPVHLSAWVGGQGRQLAAPTVKQQLSLAA
jgi:hypothetical protein